MPLTEINYLQVNIGFSRREYYRDTNHVDVHFSPMTERHFIRDVKRVLEKYCSNFSVHLGEGVWDGSSERSAHISTTTFDRPITPDVLVYLKNRLAAVAAQYGQEAIALITSSELVSVRQEIAKDF